MITAATALASLPEGLRRPLLDEYSGIVQNFLEHRWRPSELSGGLFCEIVYTILEGYAKGVYATAPSKPNNFIDACKRLEIHTHVPRSFQILIPRLLPALYEIRNNRNVGHTGGDVDPSHMDSMAVLSISAWILAELIRVFHSLSVSQAQELVDRLAERRFPIVWIFGQVRRVLDPTLKIRDQILLLLGSAAQGVPVKTLFEWLDYANEAYFRKELSKLHQQRMLNWDRATDELQILPPGTLTVEQLLARRRSA